MASLSVLPVRDFVAALSRHHRVTYQPALMDDLANALARLAGEDGHMDDTELLLLALERCGHLTADEADRLHVAYLQDGPEISHNNC